ncbi:MAG: ParB N-terminal domain-containing protein [Maritimibacter sp.]|nr:ParB N-terminal domain-containing protein [Maritimibacter sp.]
MTRIHLLPLDAIDAEALPRDRSVIDAGKLAELQRAIAANGLRQPIEVFATGAGYGLLSGYRRLMAFRALHELRGGDFAMIPAFLRPAEDVARAFARVIEENDIRAGLSAWERGRTLIVAEGAGFETLDAALAALYPHADRRKRARLRQLAEVVEAFDGQIDAPELWSENRLLRLAAVLRLGWDELVREALAHAAPGAEWEAIAPVVAEAEALPAPERATPNRPRRIVRLPRGLTIRRERNPAGYVLHITGRGATDALVGDVLDEIERLFGG